MPKLSIIIPTFNSGASIDRCLCSIANQAFSNYEVIVQDGGSSDGTLEKVQDFRTENERIDLRVFEEKDHGPYDAMNKAVRRARGEWLYFLGSDDELHDYNVLSVMLQDRNTTNCDVVYGNVKMVGDATWAKNNSIYDGVFNLRKLLSGNICHQAICYRSEFLREVGEFNLNYRVCADWDFNMRCWARTQFRYADIVVANFYAGGVSVGQADDRFLSEFRDNVCKYFGPLALGDSVAFADTWRASEPSGLRGQFHRALSWIRGITIHRAQH